MCQTDSFATFPLLFARAITVELSNLASRDKTKFSTIKQGIDFLGISIKNGAISPGKSARPRLIDKLERLQSNSQEKFLALADSRKIDSKSTLPGTLRSMSVILEGWGNHYAFCNENNVLAQLDERVDGILREILGAYRSVRERCDRGRQRKLLGVPLLTGLAAEPIPWPKATSRPVDAGRNLTVGAGGLTRVPRLDERLSALQRP